jgi:LmbE family N-acetylglucosaminyl deacetylase
MMLRLSPAVPEGRPLQVLLLGAHCDDIEIGCGGTILELIRRFPDIRIFWAVFASNPVREAEARAGAAKFLAGTSGATIQIGKHRDGFFPAEWTSIKEEVEGIRKQFEPDVVFTHYREDRHQDHRVLSDLAWNTFRNHLVLEYEIMKYDGDLGVPNFFVPLTDGQAGDKVRFVREAYASQSGKHWFVDETFTSLMRIRGLECGGAARYAEAFYLRKGVL